MKNYFTDPVAMNLPWIESPFFEQVLQSTKYSDSEKDMLRKYNKDGYLVIDLELTEDFINNHIASILTEIDKFPTQDKRYHYSDAPRVFEAWKTNKYVLELANHPKVLSTLELLYGKRAAPFQTINFIKGSNQPLHQDSIHFYTQPERWMVGTWVALEDMTESNGTLEIVPASHKLPHYTFQQLNLPTVSFGEQFENYTEYEYFLTQLIDALNLKKKMWLGKKGQAIIWASNLLHGGAPVLDQSLTRYSQATHYYFEGCNHYYSPMFSNTVNGVYAEKDLSGKDILNHKI
jgi:hypothetical protein